MPNASWRSRRHRGRKAGVGRADAVTSVTEICSGRSRIAPQRERRRDIAGTLDALLDAARGEWEHWDRSTWNLIADPPVEEVGHTDDEDEYIEYILANYCSLRGATPSRAAIRSDHYY
jgi:hypothetical protein